MSKKDIVDQVQEDLQKRKELGIKRYGVPLRTDNAREMLQEAYEEMLDFLVYFKAHLEQEREKNATTKKDTTES